MTRASDLAKLLGAGATILDGTTISTADNTEQLTLTSTDADANAGPELLLDRNSSSPADADRVGKLTFKGRNDANQTVEYGNVQSRIIDASDGTEDGRIIIQNIIAGDVAGVMESDGTETIFNNNSKDLDFRVESNGNANMLFVDGGNDKVGIGTSSPSTLFMVEPSARTTNFSASDFTTYADILVKNPTDDSTCATGIAFITDVTTYTNGASGIACISGSGDTESSLAFITRPLNAVAAERMRITSAGNVGINESSPDTKLHISNNLAGTPIATIENTASHEASIRFKTAHSSSSDFRVGASISASNNFEIYSVGAATARLKITSGGELQVPRTYNNTTGSGANMHVTSGGEFARSTSSQRYKNTINDATHGLTELLTLRPVTYKGNNDGDTVFGGLIAEEVHDAGLTEFVEYNDDGEPDALAYGHMVSLCIKAIQELKTELDEAKARIVALETA